MNDSALLVYPLAFVVLLAFCASVLAVAAKSRGRNAGGWFVYTLFLLPVAFVNLHALAKLKTCTECGKKSKPPSVRANIVNHPYKRRRTP